MNNAGSPVGVAELCVPVIFRYWASSKGEVAAGQFKTSDASQEINPASFPVPMPWQVHRKTALGTSGSLMLNALPELKNRARCSACVAGWWAR